MDSIIYTHQGYNSSLIDDFLKGSEEPVFVEEEQLSITDAGFLFSIELRREKLKKELEPLFNFSHQTKELDFISLHVDVSSLLPSIGKFFSKEFANNSQLTLELMEEENDWKTLFINIPVNTNSDWQKLNKIIDSFYDNMFDLYPTVMEKLNIDLVSYEF